MWPFWYFIKFNCKLLENMLTQLQMEINDLCGVFVLNKRNRIKVFEILTLLKYKEPILFKQLKYNDVRDALLKLFPCHRNNKKHTKYYKISIKKVQSNILNNSLIYRQIKTIKINHYGIDKTYFEKF